MTSGRDPGETSGASGKPAPGIDSFVVIWRGLSVAFWLLFGGAMLAASGWVIFATLQVVVLRDLLGQNHYRDAPHDWPLFLGCVVIFALCAYALVRWMRRLGAANTSSSS